MKILILTASTGGGHKSAAAALLDTIKKTSTDTVVEIEDGLKYCGKLYNKLICEGYVVLATKTPRLYGKLYNISDKESTINSICNNINYKEGKKLISLFNEKKPDVVISCHAFVTTMLAMLKRKNKISVPIISLITDFAPHRTYFASGIDAYVTSNENMLEEIENYNLISADKIHALGIPIADKFYKPQNKKQIAKKLEFDINKPTVLLMSGSFGVSEVLDFYESLMLTDVDCQCIVITGHNKKLYNEFSKYLSNPNVSQKPTRLFEFISNVEEYMHFADLVVTKPGGLTVTESLACSLPMAIYNAIPGQENENAQYLISQNVAISLNDAKTGGKQIAELIKDKDKLNEMRENCKKIRKENSALNIFRLAQNLVEQSQINSKFGEQV